VGVIGIGASAIQFVPPVAKEAGHLTLFQRTPNHVVPKPDRAFRAWEIFAFSHIPVVRRAYRWWTYWRLETKFNLMRRNSLLGRLLQQRIDKELSKIATPELPREVLVPDYLPGCRRLLLSNEWYPTLVRDDVSVSASQVERITPRGVQTEDGTHHDLDTIVFGTGFTTTDFLTPLKIIGSAGTDLNEAWANAPVAYLGIAVPRFPNMFILYGPNTNLGHNSILLMIEQQVSYAIAAIEQLDRRGARAVEVTDAAQQRWDAEIIERSANTVWAGNCTSWYKTDDGRITNNWVGHTTEYRRRMHTPDWDDWSFVC
ncbi:MAG: flavin-containing monooxygenase, partial [Microthrixaceae bacterium]